MSEPTFSAWTIDYAANELGRLSVDAARVREGLSELTHVEVRATVEDTAFALADVTSLLGKDARLRIVRGAQAREFCGVIEQVEGRVGADRHLHLELQIVPALALLSIGSASRIFQDMTVPEIVEEVLQKELAPYGRELRSQVTETYPKREYCVQYGESHLAFVRRLLEEEGITFRFDHEGETEVVVLSDRNAAFPKVDTVPTPGHLRFIPGSGGKAGEEAIKGFRSSHQHVATKVSLRDSIFTQQRLVVEHEEGSEDSLGRTREAYEHGLADAVTFHDYDAGVRRYRDNDLARQTRLRLEGYALDTTHSGGHGNVLGLAPGTTFVLDHPHPDFAGRELIVTNVSHTLDESEQDHYSNAFDCIPKERPFRPLRKTPKPGVASIETAVVTGPAGEEIHVDEYGRIKVQFHWDREGERDERSSCWIRTQQAWAGNGFGTWWSPRIGMEVIVQFLGGDPDRPIVTGCVYNAENALPYPLPDDKTKSTIKSKSSLDSDGFNELRFEDKAGSEEIWLHAQKDLNEKVLNDHTLDVGNNETITVAVDQSQTIGSNQAEKVGANATLDVGANRTITVGGNFEETVSGNETRTVSGSVTETVTSGETRTVNAGQTVTINGGETKTVVGGVTYEVLGPVIQNVTATMTTNVVGMIHISTPSNYTLNVTGPLVQISATGTETCEPKKSNYAPQKEDYFQTKVSAGILAVSARAIATSLIGVKQHLGVVKMSTVAVNIAQSALKHELRGYHGANKGIEFDVVGLKVIV